MIIAIKEKDRVVVGYSNADCWGRLSVADYTDEENVPIKFSSNGNLWGFASLNRFSDMMIYDEKLLGTKINHKSVVREVIPRIKELLAQNECIGNGEEWGNALLVCDDDNLYGVSASFGFRDENDYLVYAYASATDFIKSALDSTVGTDAKERIVKAVEFACKMSRENFFPLTITDTKTKQFTCVYKGENL